MNEISHGGETYHKNMILNNATMNRFDETIWSGQRSTLH